MATSDKNSKSETVEQYLQTSQPIARNMLQTIRAIIRKEVPEAEELISYQIPSYKLNGMLVGFAAFKNHCSFFVMSGTLLDQFKEEIEGYTRTKSALHLPLDQKVPVKLIKKLIAAKVKENAEREIRKLAKKKAKNAAVPKKVALKNSDEETVKAHMLQLKLYPMLAEIEVVRKLIQKADPEIHERIKWNAPSYYIHPDPSPKAKDIDLVTFHHRVTTHVHLIFHHPQIIHIESALLEGTYPDRRMIYLRSMKEVKAASKELTQIIRELIQRIKNS